MNPAAWLLIIVCCCMTGASALVVWWSWKTGQFDDTEGIKYRMLEDE
jgi:cbb3-type cytochrome oxidase maturation protein